MSAVAAWFAGGGVGWGGGHLCFPALVVCPLTSGSGFRNN